MKTKFLSVILAVLVLLAGAAIPGGTSAPLSITAPSFEILAGHSTLTFSVTISDLPQRGLMSCRFNTRIDGARFISAEPNAALGGFLGVGPLEGSEKNGIEFFWLNYGAPITSDTVAVTYTVELPEDAGGDDELAIVITPSDDTDDFVDSGANGVGAAGVNGLIKILCDHVLVYQPYIPASCENAGQIAHRRCRICQKCFSAANEAVPISKEDIPIPAYGHIWQSWETLSEPGCTMPGIQMRTCLNDNVHTQMRAVPADGHTMTYIPAVPPTLTSDGSIAHWRCDFCDRCFEDPSAVIELDAQSIIQKRIRPGDANGDGKVNSRDIIAIMKAMLGQEPTPFYPEAADVNGDGKTNARDIIAITKTM